MQWNESVLVSNIQHAEDYCNLSLGGFFVMESSPQELNSIDVLRRQENSFFLGARFTPFPLLFSSARFALLIL